MFVEINMGDSPIGMGRRYLVATKGRKYWHLFYIPTLTSFSVSYAQWHAMRPKEVIDCKPNKLLRMLKAKRKLYEGLQLWDGGKHAERARGTLKAMACS